MMPPTKLLLHTRRACLGVLTRVALLPVLVGRAAAGEAGLTAARERLLREIESDYRATAGSTGLMQPGASVRRALLAVPRERFVSPRYRDAAYANRPLPIDAGQTISQPFIVALMTDLLQLSAGARVLEVGTGSGYQAAVLAEAGMNVYSIEIVPSLAEQARSALDAAGYTSVRTRVGDGYLGWPDAAPFDGIIVTAAPDHVPPALVEQLKPGARMVIPVGPTLGAQDLLVIRKSEDGSSVTRRTLPVRFVPLTRNR